MNLLMAGMVPTVMALKSRIPSAADPTTPRFWFVMSMGLLVGFIFAYPMNWWLVAHHLKHGMMTVRPAAAAAAGHAHAGMDTAAATPRRPCAWSSGETPWPPVPVMTLLSFLALAAGMAIALLLRADVSGGAVQTSRRPRAHNPNRAASARAMALLEEA